jgi:tRNA(Ile2) C34 agmatinyltransferase TiaS
MTGAVLDRPGTEQIELDGGLTLEELLNRTLHRARAQGSAECPVCRATMTSTRAGAGDMVAVCAGCGSRLG